MTVVLENVTRVVGAISLHQRRLAHARTGTLSVLLGPTLSGKTSLMRLLAGLDPPTTGRVVVNAQGRDGRRRPQAFRGDGLPAIRQLPSFTVSRTSPRRCACRWPAQRGSRARVGEVASLLRLEPYLERTPLALSGGQQQRTAIARALVKGADLVLLDEPLANLDYKLREELRTELPRIFEVSGAIFVYATTEPSEALLLGGRTICMSEAAPCRSAAAVERLPPAGQPQGGGAVFRSAAQYGEHREEATARVSYRRRRHGAGQRPLCRAGRRPYSVGFRAHQLALADGAAGHHRLSDDGGSSPKSPARRASSISEARRRELGRRCCPASTNSPPGHALEAALDPNDIFVFAPTAGWSPRRDSA